MLQWLWDGDHVESDTATIAKSYFATWTALNVSQFQTCLVCEHPLSVRVDAAKVERHLAKRNSTCIKDILVAFRQSHNTWVITIHLIRWQDRLKGV